MNADDTPTDAARIHANLEALLPEVEKRGDEIAEQRRLPSDLVEQLRAAGAFRMAIPRARGGPELTPREQTEMIEMLSIADPSVGWCVMIGSDSPYVASFLSPDAVDDVFPDIDMITAGLAQPAGRAVPVEGGYRVSGKWAFGSGCTHADVILGGCLVFDDDGTTPRMRTESMPEWRIVLAPASSWEILDTWYTTGLAGSGSNDYTVQDLFVPAAHTFTFWDPSQRPEPLYAFPGTFLTNMAGVPLGIARTRDRRGARGCTDEARPPRIPDDEGPFPRAQRGRARGGEPRRGSCVRVRVARPGVGPGDRG